MANVKAFKCIRPNKGLESKIAALPYDVYNRQEAEEVVKANPMSFLKIDRAETQFDNSVATYDDKVYDKAHELLWGMVEDTSFIKDEIPGYYVYELVMNGRSQTGIVACSSIDDYLNNVIKKHENTRAEKEIDRINHVDRCNAQTGPIFLAYKSNQVINEVVAKKQKEEPMFSFVAEDGVTHSGWKIEEESDVTAIANAFSSIDSIYIADGHHRAASAVKVGLKRRETTPTYTGTEEFNFFLSVLFPDDQLMIMDYNRAVKDLNNHTKESFLEEAGKVFEIENLGSTGKKPEVKGTITMFLDGEWYLLTIKKEFKSEHPVDGLDVSILQDKLLEPVLGILDPKTDNRIDFIGGIRGIEELERRVSLDCKVAFAMYPTGINELFSVSDADLLMPPKSTWFEPKLRSGLFIHEI